MEIITNITIVTLLSTNIKSTVKKINVKKELIIISKDEIKACDPALILVTILSVTSEVLLLIKY